MIKRNLEEVEELLEVGDGGDRCAVFLINPGMKDLKPVGWKGATQTLYAVVQAIKPGEIAVLLIGIQQQQQLFVLLWKGQGRREE